MRAVQLNSNSDLEKLSSKISDVELSLPVDASPCIAGTASDAAVLEHQNNEIGDHQHPESSESRSITAASDKSGAQQSVRKSVSDVGPVVSESLLLLQFPLIAKGWSGLHHHFIR